MIQLGDRVRDIVTGFEGIATKRLESLFGGVEIQISPEGLGQTGEPLTSIWFEEARVLESVSNNRLEKIDGENETRI